MISANKGAGKSERRQAAGNGGVERVPFRTSTKLDFFTEKGLTSRTGHDRRRWLEMAVRELVDNALDACEAAGVAPRIEVSAADGWLTVADNGPGIPADVIRDVVNFDLRVSTNSRYVSPTRGQQGNALKTLAALTFVDGGSTGRMLVSTPDGHHAVTVELDQVLQEPVVSVRIAASGSGPYPGIAGVQDLPNAGTTVRLHLPTLAGGPLNTDEVLAVLAGYATFNPHADLCGSFGHFPPNDPAWKKWLPSEPMPPHWYNTEDLVGLVAAYVGAGQDLNVRDFVALFAGLRGTAKRKAVVDAADLGRAKLSDLVRSDGVDDQAVARLLSAMRERSRPIPPTKLGLIGRPHFEERLCDGADAAASFEYAKVCGDQDGQPFVVEAAFAWDPKLDGRALICGVNWAPTFGATPFRDLHHTSLDYLLADQRCADDEGIAVAVHIATPKPGFRDQGKSSLSLYGAKAEAVITAVEKVTRTWAKQKRAEERDAASRERRVERLRRERRREEMTLKEAIFRVMEEAIHKASGGRFVFPSRNLYYSARDLIQALTDKELTQKYFDARRKEWEAQHGVIELLYSDPRGHLIEPHTETLIPLGTREVDAYVIPPWRYHTILFIEKKGFGPMLKTARLAEKYDMAIMSSEGYATDAAKALLAQAERGERITVLCLHDADPYGKNICRKLRHATLRSGGVNVIDVGLDLEFAVEELGLPTEKFVRKKALPKIEMTAYERERWAGVFIGTDGHGRRMHRCERVELNALAADPDRFIAYIESQLERHGCNRKLVPPEDVLGEKVSAEHRKAIAERAHGLLLERLAIPEAVERITCELVERIDVGGVAAAVREAAATLDTRPWDGIVRDLIGGIVHERAALVVQSVDEDLRKADRR